MIPLDIIHNYHTQHIYIYICLPIQSVNQLHILTYIHTDTCNHTSMCVRMHVRTQAQNHTPTTRPHTHDHTHTQPHSTQTQTAADLEDTAKGGLFLTGNQVSADSKAVNVMTLQSNKSSACCVRLSNTH